MIYNVIAGKEKQMLHAASRMMKIIMLFGILYSLVAGALIISGKIF
ncbi:MAG: hypothetical protein MZV63_04995 [Marinilabiliales bacterium]|nr:hypothetical protein [Marinilabiliales bacterium]